LVGMLKYRKKMKNSVIIKFLIQVSHPYFCINSYPRNDFSIG
jgi:hypothetical protein